MNHLPSLAKTLELDEPSLTGSIGDILWFWRTLFSYCTVSSSLTTACSFTRLKSEGRNGPEMRFVSPARQFSGTML